VVGIQIKRISLVGAGPVVDCEIRSTVVRLTHKASAHDNQPQRRSKPLCTRFRLSSCWVLSLNFPKPPMFGISTSIPFDVSVGLNALNRVTNFPSGLRKYPTDPVSTMDGDHNGNTTV